MNDTTRDLTGASGCIEWMYGRTWGESFHACGKKISPKDPDGKRCGLHYGAKLRREQKTADAVDARQTIESYAARAAAAVEVLGIGRVLPETVYRDGVRVATGDVTIKLTDLEHLARRIQILEDGE